MYIIFYILPIVILIPAAIYFYFFFKRVFQSLKVDTQVLWIKVLIAILSVIFVYPARNFFGFWALIVLHLFAFAVVFDLIHLFLSKKEIHRYDRIYQSGIIPVFCVLLILGYGYWNMNNVHQTHYTIQTEKKLSQDYRIALMTDLHFGNTMDQEKLKVYCDQISKQKPDIVLLGGDIVDERSTPQQVQQAFEALNQIETQYGIYYVYGNHDRRGYSSTIDMTPDELQQVITSSGIHVLTDEVATIHNELFVVGREDRNRMNRKESSELINGLDQRNFLIAFDHQPVNLDINDSLGFDLQLSGHTHGGQMFPVGILTDLLGFGEMNYGYRQLDHMQVIVSSGIAGWGYPLRTGSHSEYVIIDIQRK